MVFIIIRRTTSELLMLLFIVAVVVVAVGLSPLSVGRVEGSCEPFGPSSVIYQKYIWFDGISTILSLPLVLDVTDDGQPEVFFLASTIDDNNCTLYDGTQLGFLQALQLITDPGGGKHFESWWTIDGNFPSYTHMAIAKVPATAPQQYIICGYATLSSFFCVDALDGNQLFTQPLRNTSTPLCVDYYNAFSSVALTKLDSTDKLYLLASSEVWEYNPISKTVVFHCAVTYSGRLQIPYAADIDFDGVSELFFDNCVYSFPSCLMRWCTPTQPTFDGITAAVANFDAADSYPEVAMVGDGKVTLYRKDGGVPIWETDISYPYYAGGPPAVADFDGDGVPDIGINNEPLYAVISGVNGKFLASYSVIENSHFTSSASFDFQLDGKSEMLHCGAEYCTVFSSDGWSITVPKLSDTGSEYSVVVDVDNDGMVDWLTVGRGLTVFSTNDSWPNTIATWTMHGHNGYDLNGTNSFPQVTRPSNMFRSNPAMLVVKLETLHSFSMLVTYMKLIMKLVVRIQNSCSER